MKTILLSCLLIIVLGFAVYANSLKGEFVWDDEHFIQNNVYIKNWSNIGKIFTESMGAGGGVHTIYRFYRPLHLLSYMIDYWLWGLKVHGYHLTNIALHVLVAISAFWLINILFKDMLIALFACIFFVIHPIHVEAVSYISGRADLLVALFILLAFISYIKCLEKNTLMFFLLMSTTYLAALLSKEFALILPVILLVYHYSFKKKLRLKQFLPLVATAFVYILIRFTILGFLLHNSSHYKNTTFIQRIPGFFVAISTYLKLIIVPFNLHMEYGKGLFRFTHPQAIIGLFILICLFIYLVKQKAKSTLVFFPLSWFFILLLPFSNLYPVNAYMAEHWLYLPSIGLFIILGKGLVYLYRTKQVKFLSIFISVSLLTFYSLLTIKQNNYWKDCVTFYERTLKFSQGSPRIYNNLGNAYYKSGKKEEALALYKKAIELNPDFVYAYSNMGVIYSETGRKEEAIDFLKQAITVNPNLADSHFNLGNVYKEIGQTEESISLYKQAIEINPNFAKAYNNLGIVYRCIGKTEEAITSYKKAVAIDPNYAQAYHNLSVIYFENKKYQLAIEYCDKARKLGYTNRAFLKALEPYQ